MAIGHLELRLLCHDNSTINIVIGIIIISIIIIIIINSPK